LKQVEEDSDILYSVNMNGIQMKLTKDRNNKHIRSWNISGKKKKPKSKEANVGYLDPFETNNLIGLVATRTLFLTAEGSDSFMEREIIFN